ncbi:hypothetical protein X743_11620 [Mesorhizobium sp. LNHC252B00]|nr:hypothetical protein X743_11620 [Mesorhizobium sp. LNHC252B00]
MNAPKVRLTATAAIGRACLPEAVSGQIAGLDSAEGPSLNLACGEGPATLPVDVGEMDKLISLQSLALPDDIAKPR